MVWQHPDGSVLCGDCMGRCPEVFDLSKWHPAKWTEACQVCGVTDKELVRRLEAGARILLTDAIAKANLDAAIAARDKHINEMSPRLAVELLLRSLEGIR